MSDSIPPVIQELADACGLPMQKCKACGTEYFSRHDKSGHCPPCAGTVPLEHYEGRPEIESERDKVRAAVMRQASAHWHSDDPYVCLQRALAEAHSWQALRRSLSAHLDLVRELNGKSIGEMIDALKGGQHG